MTESDLPPATGDVDRVLYAPRELPPLRPDAASCPDAYAAWSADQRPASAGDENDESVDVVVLMGADQPGWLADCLQSLTAQTHRPRTLSVASARALPPEALAALASVREVTQVRGARESDPATVLAAAVDSGTSPLVCLVDHDAVLDPACLAHLLDALADGVCAYADHDTNLGPGPVPSFKPDWSPELALSTDYLSWPLLLRRDRLEQSGGIRPSVGGDWRHDLVLRLTELGSVGHASRVLCHRRVATAWNAGSTAIDDALARSHEHADIGPGPLPGTWRVRRGLPARPGVTVIVPFRDAAPLLRTCVDTVSATAPGWPLEWLLVDNGSTEPETATLLERLDRRPDVTVLADGRPFNWSALNNMAMARATGELVLFLNNDIEAVRPGWLEALAVQALRLDVAAVGARLLYPGGRLQHAGIVLGMGGAAGHVLAGLAPGEPGYGGIAVLPREVSAVTGACLLSRRSVVRELGGFDEGLGMDLNDVDYCLRAWAAGYRVLYEPAAELVHHESPSRGTSGSPADIRRFVDRWEGAIRRSDPFFNPNLTRVDSSCALRSPGEEEWWQRWRSILERS